MATEVKTQTAGEGVAQVLVANDLTTGFGIPGIHNLGLYDALAGEPRIKHFVVRHEQGAGFAADGFARVSGKPGLAITTTGPGAFNALTAISEAYLDSSPVLLLAGQIDSRLHRPRLGHPARAPRPGRGVRAGHEVPGPAAYGRISCPQPVRRRDPRDAHRAATGPRTWRCRRTCSSSRSVGPPDEVAVNVRPPQHRARPRRGGARSRRCCRRRSGR